MSPISAKQKRKFIRDDGLSIDWSSPVPVWSDTLTPGTMDLATAITEAHRMNAQRRRRQSRKESLPGSQHPSASREQPSNGSDDVYDSSPTKRKLPPPPRPSSMRRVIAAPVIPSPPAGSHLTPVKDVSPQPQSSAPPDNEVTIIERPLSTPSSGPSKDILRPSISESETAAEQDILDVTINYLRRYIQTYDTDRASLASAYSRFASFSYRVHEISCCHEMSSAPPRPSPELAKRSRLDIITTLLTLPPLHSLPSPSLAVAKLDYDMSYLGARLGMFVVARVVLPSRTIVHNFVLQRKEADAEEAASAGVWSLVANAHQIIIFEA
ncbi:hypothetical protein F5I97DRAFT_1488860 [Phlebopus sp. FC_14]|nr:hypothetical protein F5I97DRAFT_1488860 [Phlebopus sp. FC_14]